MDAFKQINVGFSQSHTKNYISGTLMTSVVLVDIPSADSNPWSWSQFTGICTVRDHDHLPDEMVYDSGFKLE